VLLIGANGKATTLRGVDSPLAKRGTLHAATPEGSLSTNGGPLAVSSNGLAWQTSTVHIDPSMDLQKYVDAFFRTPLPGGGDRFIGGFTGVGGSSGPLAQCTASAGYTPRSFRIMELSEQTLAYVAAEPPAECPQDQAVTSLKLIVRSVADGQLGAERVLGEAPLPAPGGRFPFTGLRVAGSFVEWFSPTPGSDAFTAHVVDARTGATVYEISGLLPYGIALGEDGTMVTGMPGGSSAWASPSDPTLHPLGAGLPWALAGSTALLEDGRSLVLQSLDGTRRQLVAFKLGERRVGSVDYDGVDATWATRRKRCTVTRVRTGKHRRKQRRRRCKQVDSVFLQRVG
jgi:hypothetical protein